MEMVSNWYSEFNARMRQPIQALISGLRKPKRIAKPAGTPMQMTREVSPILQLPRAQLERVFTFENREGDPDKAASQAEVEQLMMHFQSRDWSELGALIERHDQVRTALPSGRRMTAVFEKSLWDRLFEQAREGDAIANDSLAVDAFIPLLEAAEAHPESYSLRSLAALMHVRLAWSFVDDAAEPKEIPEFRDHMRQARILVAELGARSLNASLVAKAQYLAIAGSDFPIQTVSAMHRRYMALDPSNLCDYAMAGEHLLPNRNGDYKILAESAQEIYAATCPKYGAAAYATLYFTAIEANACAVGSVDLERFCEGLVDLIDSAEDPDLMSNILCNRLWQYCLSQHSFVHCANTLPLKYKHDEFTHLFKDLVRKCLGVVMPDVWAENLDSETLLYVLADVFRDEIMSGHPVHIGSHTSDIAEMSAA